MQPRIDLLAPLLLIKQILLNHASASLPDILAYRASIYDHPAAQRPPFLISNTARLLASSLKRLYASLALAAREQREGYFLRPATILQSGQWDRLLLLMRCHLAGDDLAIIQKPSDKSSALESSSPFSN